MSVYTRDRSQFWLGIFDNDDSSINISATNKVKYMIDYFFTELVDCSPKEWTPSKNRPNIQSLWIPDALMDWDQLELLKEWADQANQYIWLGTNRYTHDLFHGAELDYCVAADWNFSFEGKGRTAVGEAEYQLKYQFPKRIVTESARAKYASVLMQAITGCIQKFPYDLKRFVVTTIPSVENNQNKLSWQLARYVANHMGIPFIGVTLTRNKPQIKEQIVEDKIRIWREIYSDNAYLLLPQSILSKDILIIDDLYQSGASIWCFAEFLKKKCKARTVLAATSVKSVSDGDNK